MDAIGALGSLVKCEFDIFPSLVNSLIRSLSENTETKISASIASTLLSLAQSNTALFLNFQEILLQIYLNAKSKDVRIHILELLLLFE